MTDKSGPAKSPHRLHIIDAQAKGSCALLVKTLSNGGIVSFPTDTVYALAASLRSPRALSGLYLSKHRPLQKPIPVLLASTADLERVAQPGDRHTAAFLNAVWPGPTTVVLAAHEEAPDAVTGIGHDEIRTVAVRVPDHVLAMEVIKLAGGAVAATSANISDQPPGLTASEVAAQLGDSVDLILDGGSAPGGIASTVVRLTQAGPVVLRQGALKGADLVELWRLAGSSNGK